MPKKAKQTKKKKAPRSRAGPRVGSRTSPSMSLLTAPVSQGLMVRPRNSIQFGMAPATEDFPEGGLRLAMSWKSASDLATNGSGETSSVGGWGTGAAGNGTCVMFLNPSNIFIGGFTGLSQPLGSAPASVRAFADYFRCFRYRKLVATLATDRATSETGHVVLGYDRDASLALMQSSAYGNQTYDGSVGNINSYVEGLQQSIRLPVWGNGSTVLIQDKNINDPNSRLFRMGFGGSVTTSPDISALLSATTQGALPAYVGAVSSTTSRVTAHEVLFSAILDLYGFVPAQPDVTPELDARRSVFESKTESKATVRSVLPSSRLSQSAADPDGDYELLSLRGQGLRQKAETKVSAKGGSLN